jgi:hypothetical protein
MKKYILATIETFLLLFLLLLPIIATAQQCPSQSHFWTNVSEGEGVMKEPTCWHPEAIVFSWSSIQKGGMVALYRYCDSKTGYFFYTTNLAEGDALIKAVPTYKKQGRCGWVAPNSSSAPGTIPVYRFSHPDGRWFYTTNKKGEIAPEAGYMPNGPAFCVWSPGAQDMNIVRFYSPAAAHEPLTHTDLSNWQMITRQNYCFQNPAACAGPGQPGQQYNGVVTFINPSGSAHALHIYATIVANTSTSFDFCGSTMVINTVLNPGYSTSPYTITKGILDWQAFYYTSGGNDCNGDNVSNSGYVYKTSCNNCLIPLTNL